jgi:hypothetical protein
MACGLLPWTLQACCFEMPTLLGLQSNRWQRQRAIWSVQVPVGDADFKAVREVKAPLLTKACRRLLTDDRFAGKHLANF